MKFCFEADQIARACCYFDGFIYETKLSAKKLVINAVGIVSQEVSKNPTTGFVLRMLQALVLCEICIVSNNRK